MKYFLILLFLFTKAQAQYFGVRYSPKSQSVGMSVPIPKAEILMVLSKEDDRKLVYLQYVEKTALNKWFSLIYGAGIHMGGREVLRFKRDANSIFLAGATCVGGFRFEYKKIMFQTDLMPRTDFPVFGGCFEHKYCKESTLGAVNFSLNIKL